jgi:hypothetical protein
MKGDWMQLSRGQLLEHAAIHLPLVEKAATIKVLKMILRFYKPRE